MHVQINLASRPFVELRPFFLRLRLIMAALAVVGLALALSARLLTAKAEHQQLQLDGLRNQTISVQQSRIHTEQRLRDPVNAGVLDRAHFLNTLFLRKSFSWTAVMMDLETVLPAGVQVTAIEPQVSPDGNVIIRLRVAGERANAVGLVRNLERSRRFLQPRLLGEASQAKENAANGQRAAGGGGSPPMGPPGVEFEILADYNPLPAGESYNARHGGRTAEFRPDGSTRLSSIPIIRPARPSRAPGARVRAGFPRDGVLLKPYSAGRAPVPAAPQGGPR